MLKKKRNNSNYNILFSIIGKPDEFILEHRFFNVACFITSIGGFLLSIFNILLNLDPLITISTLIYSIITLVLYYFSRFKNKFKILVWPFILITLPTISYIWLLNYGTYGPVIYVFFSLAILFIIITRGITSIVIPLIFLFNIFVLFFIEYKFPHLFSSYENKTIRFFDLLFTFSVCLLFLSYAIKYLMKNYHKERKTAIRQRDLVTLQKKEITDSIYYAEKIQIAILPSKEFINNILDNYFILYKPRDIISGDFYWINKVHPPTTSQTLPAGRQGEVEDLGGASIIIAVADCTGHGVPGAFMSILGTTLLNEIVIRNNITVPNQILNQLKENIINSLHQNYKDQKTYDGMDIALIVIDTETNKLQFAGANNPLYIIRNHEKSNNKIQMTNKSQNPNSKSETLNSPHALCPMPHALIEIKGDRMPIGIFSSEVIPFTNHEIQLHTGDTLYMFSDGFPDQFGGKNGKKFTKKQFKQLLIEIQDKSMPEQKEILDKTIKEWQGDSEQIDDILVAGIRI